MITQDGKKIISEKPVTPLQFVYSTGLLFEINRCILHPFGLALAVILDDVDDTAISIEFQDARSEEGGMVYDSESIEAGTKKIASFLRKTGFRQLEIRKKLAGTLVQGILPEWMIINPLQAADSPEVILEDAALGETVSEDSNPVSANSNPVSVNSLQEDKADPSIKLYKLKDLTIVNEKLTRTATYCDHEIEKQTIRGGGAFYLCKLCGSQFNDSDLSVA